MREILGEETTTLSHGAILSVQCWRDTTQARAGRPHVELIATRGAKKVMMRLEGVSTSPGTLRALLELCRRQIEKILASGQTLVKVQHPEDFADFAGSMMAADMFISEALEAAK